MAFEDAGGEGGEGEAIEAGAAAVAAGEGGAPAAGGDAAGGGEGDGAEAPWYDGLSDEQADEKTLSDKAWMKNKGYADLPALVKAARASESKIAAAKGVEVPGEDATEEQVAAYRKAIGVPETAEDYGFEVPEGWEQDMGAIEGLRAAAFEGGMPAGAWDKLTEAYKAQVMDAHNALVTAQNGERDEVYKEWGAQKDQNLALFQRGIKAFDLSADQVQAMQSALGPGGTKVMMELGLKLGRLSGEDGFIRGIPKAHSISAADARNELARLEKDGAFIAKLQAKDPAAKARHERLIAIISDDDARRAAETV